VKKTLKSCVLQSVQPRIRVSAYDRQPGGAAVALDRRCRRDRRSRAKGGRIPAADQRLP
jgi:hypothetical protein